MWRTNLVLHGADFCTSPWLQHHGFHFYSLDMEAAQGLWWRSEEGVPGGTRGTFHTQHNYSVYWKWLIRSVRGLHVTTFTHSLRPWWWSATLRATWGSDQRTMGGQTDVQMILINSNWAGNHSSKNRQKFSRWAKNLQLQQQLKNWQGHATPFRSQCGKNQESF